MKQNSEKMNELYFADYYEETPTPITVHHYIEGTTTKLTAFAGTLNV